jgi:hypothetical protein
LGAVAVEIWRNQMTRLWRNIDQRLFRIIAIWCELLILSSVPRVQAATNPADSGALEATSRVAVFDQIVQRLQSDGNVAVRVVVEDSEGDEAWIGRNLRQMGSGRLHDGALVAS